jgi:hypothetical protein
MDLELIAHFHPPVENLNGIGLESDGAVFLYWLDARWNLQSSSNLVNWLTVPSAASPWSPVPGRAQEFYQWVR